MRSAKQFQNDEAKREQLLADIHAATIVKVTAFDPIRLTVDVQPLLQRPRDGGYETQPPVLGVPIAPTVCGGFVVRPWYKPGDVGLVVYLDQDMDAALLSGDVTRPTTQRRHAPDDAVFVGGIAAGGQRVEGLPDDALVLATLDGSIYLAVTKDGISIKGDVTVEGEVTAKGVPLTTHQHSGVQTGGSTSGPPD